MALDKRIKEYLKTLQRRGSHRLAGNSILGSINAYLNGFFFIRMIVNFGLVLDLAGRGSALNMPQIAEVFSLTLFLYLAGIGSLSTHCVGLSLPGTSFITLSPGGREFRTRFLVRSAVSRPLHIIAAAFLIISAVAFSFIGGLWERTLFTCCVPLLITPLAMYGTVALAARTLRTRQETQILEFIILLFIITRNPDIGPHDGMVAMSFAGYYLSVYSLPAFLAATGAIAAATPLLLLVGGALSVIGRHVSRSAIFSPIAHWYLRLIKIRTWVIVYIAAVPALFSSLATAGMKRWTMVMFVFFAAGSFLYFIISCEDTLKRSWRRSLFDGGNRRHLMEAAGIHAACIFVPVIGFIIDHSC